MEAKTITKTEEKKTATKVTPAVSETKTAAKAVKTPAEKAVKGADVAAKKTAKAETKPVKAEKEAAKPVAKKAAKPAAKKAVKPAAKTKAAAKTVKPAADKKVNIVLQYSGREYNTEEIVAKVKAAATAETGKKTFKSLDIYVKPEENVAYYVVNGRPGSVQL